MHGILPPIEQSSNVGTLAVCQPPPRKNRGNGWRPQHLVSAELSDLQSKKSAAKDKLCISRFPDLASLGDGWKVAPDYVDQLTRVVELDDPDLVIAEGFSTFMQQVGHSNSHFLDGFLGELSGQGSEAAGRASPHDRRLPRKAPLSFFFGPKSVVEQSVLGKRQASPPRKRGRGAKDSAQNSAQNSPRCPNSGTSISKQHMVSVDHTEVIKRSSKRQQEACESLRILVFGTVGNEHWKESDKPKVFEQHRGSMKELGEFVGVWNQMDDDHSGDIDFGEFQDFFAKSKGDKLLCMRCVKYLLATAGHHVSEQDGLARKSNHVPVTRPDMLRLIWLKATNHDVDIMMQMFDFHTFLNARAPDPPVLPKKKRRQLLENFYYLDKESRGVIQYMDLMSGGLVDSEMMKELQEMHDPSGSGHLSQDVFLEMLCPYGFLAHERVQRIATTDDQLIVHCYVDCQPEFHLGYHEVSGWILESEMDRLREQTSLSIRLAPAALVNDLLV